MYIKGLFNADRLGSWVLGLWLMFGGLLLVVAAYYQMLKEGIIVSYTVIRNVRIGFFGFGSCCCILD